jgi:hypothetical protein
MPETGLSLAGGKSMGREWELGGVESLRVDL